jgi:hypothetical protein
MQFQEHNKHLSTNGQLGSQHCDGVPGNQKAGEELQQQTVHKWFGILALAGWCTARESRTYDAVFTGCMHCVIQLRVVHWMVIAAAGI